MYVGNNSYICQHNAIISIKFAILQMTLLKHSLWISLSKTGNF